MKRTYPILAVIFLLVCASWVGVNAADKTADNKDADKTVSTPAVGTADGTGAGEASDTKDTGKIEAVLTQTQETIKEKEGHVEAAKAQAEQAINEKKAIEEEARLKEEAATTAKQELEVTKKEASLTNNAEARKKTRLLEQEAKKLGKEANLYSEKLSVAEQKVQVALDDISVKEARIDNLRKMLDKLKRDKAAKSDVFEKLFNIVLILIGAFLSYLFVKFVAGIVWNVAREKKGALDREKALRIKTLSKMFFWISAIGIVAIAVYLILEVFGLSVAPILAGAGIAGLAFGFGGQYLIRDLISGFFILMEGQYNINDIIQIGEYGGVVEDLNLRITILRDLEGRVIFIPNGEIKTVVNFTKEYSQALLDISVAYKENVDKVMDVIKDIGAGMRKDPYFGPFMLDDLEMLGVDGFGEYAMIVKFRIKTIPVKQWEISREFRRRLKNRFDELGIEMPFPRRVIYMNEGSPSSRVRNR